MLTVTYSIVALELEQKKSAGPFLRFRNTYVTVFEIFVPQVAPVAWLGDAIAIKDPTAAIFRTKPRRDSFPCFTAPISWRKSRSFMTGSHTPQVIPCDALAILQDACNSQSEQATMPPSTTAPEHIHKEKPEWHGFIFCWRASARSAGRWG